MGTPTVMPNGRVFFASHYGSTYCIHPNMRVVETTETCISHVVPKEEEDTLPHEAREKLEDARGVMRKHLDGKCVKCLGIGAHFREGPNRFSLGYGGHRHGCAQELSRRTT